MKTICASFLFVILSFSSWGVQARCKSESKHDYIQRTPFFVKGLVKEKKLNGNKVSFKIQVLRTFKRSVSEDVLSVSYTQPSESVLARNFRSGKVYVFGVQEIDDDEIEIDFTKCTPLLKEQDLVINGYDPDTKKDAREKKWQGI